MKQLEILFWISLIVVFYSYAGYGILAIVISKAKSLKKFIPLPVNRVNRAVSKNDELPRVSLIISMSGEPGELIKRKIENTKNLIYPKNKLEVIYAAAMEKPDDSALMEYYNFYIPETNTGLSSDDEYLYALFSEFEGEGISRNKELLNQAESLLLNNNVSSSKLTLNSKKTLDKLASQNFDRILLTKDVIRKGKISQVNRTISHCTGEIIIFSDANTDFNKEAIINIVKNFRDSSVGCVAGEKRVKKEKDSTSGDGEGLYWKYESKLKEADSSIWSTVGAAGEIYAIRKELWDKAYTPGAIIEDFVISMKIAEAGYKVVYEKDAYASEDPTTGLKDEFIRRRRIAAGGFQSIIMLLPLLNIFKYRILSFQYISHRVLRWAVVPFLLPVLLFVNVMLAMNGSQFYSFLLAGQVMFYLLAAAGFYLESINKKILPFYFPFFLVMLNAASYAGLKRYLTGNQSVVWERVNRNNN